MSGLRLCQLDVSRLLIQIGENSCAEANRGYVFFKFQVLFNAVTHLRHLCAGKRFVTAESKASFIHAEMRQRSGGQGNGAFTAARFRVLDLRLVALGVCNGLPDINLHALRVTFRG